MEKVCKTAGELKAALADVADDVAIVNGTTEGVEVRVMFEKNIATGRTRHVLTFDEPVDEPGFDDEDDDFDDDDEDL